MYIMSVMTKKTWFSGSFGEVYLLRLCVVAAIIVICIFCYEMSMRTYKHEYSILSSHLKRLEEEKKQALNINSNLLLRVNSQSDPAWIELILIEGLGLCPEGHQKVVFANDKLMESWQ